MEPLIRSGALTALLTLLSLPVFAQGTAFTYQGRLNDGASPANGSYDLRFAIYDALTVGTQQGSLITYSAMTVSNGLFTVTLDFGDQFPGANRWLEIGVRTNGGAVFTVLASRQLLTATPYAVTAGNVTGGVAASQMTGIIAAGNIGAGTISSTMLANGAVGSNQLAAGAVTAANIASISNWFPLTLFKPTPAAYDNFGISVAAVGNDRVLVGAQYDNAGATDAGAGYLFSTNGTLLVTFTNPTPAGSDNFGYSLAAVGSDRVLIGAFGDNTGASAAGAAYLFSTNGTLLTTFTNPTPANGDYFGYAVAALGTDRVLISAYMDDTGSMDSGAAYLFSTNGTLLTTFTNPTPAISDYFGNSVAAVGSDRVLIGASGDNTGAGAAGAAYLFSTNGTLLTTFTNPTPANSDYFGVSVAAVGSDRVLIVALYDDTGAPNAGAAYLFSTNGTLITTFTNPTPATDDYFGRSVAAVGSDRVLIGAYGDDTAGTDAGAAYLFNTNGTLLATFTNPSPAAYDYFGYAVAALGSNRVLIGANGEAIGAPNTGSAYVFSQTTYASGLVADAVHPTGVTSASLQDGAVTLSKLDPTIGVWTRSGDNIFRADGNVGIGTTTPTARLEVAGDAKAASMSFGASLSPKLNLYSTSFGIGIQNSTLYSRVGTGCAFAWYAGGVHNDGPLNPGGGATLMILGGGGLSVNGTFVSASDRNLKQDFAVVDSRSVLDKVAQLPIQTWVYKNDPGTKHLGPMAQDFYAAFAVGPDDKHITTVDESGVALAAIQGLNEKLESGKRKAEIEIEALKAENEELKARLEKLERLLLGTRGGAK